ncbi:MAG: hypothetical protein VW915_07495 [Gammaproteobacteria bacterium]
MGFWRNLFFGSYRDKKPIIIAPSGYIVKEIIEKGGRGHLWVIKYSSESWPNLIAKFTVTRGTRSVTQGEIKFTINWP